MYYYFWLEKQHRILESVACVQHGVFAAGQHRPVGRNDETWWTAGFILGIQTFVLSSAGTEPLVQSVSQLLCTVVECCSLSE